MKWKELSTVISALLSSSNVVMFFDSHNSMKIMKRTSFWLCSKGKSRTVCFNDLFWKLQFKENENDFQLSFWLWFNNNILLSFLITFFFEVSFQGKWKGPCLWFYSNSRFSLLMTFFWKLQFKENEKTFNCHFGFGFTAKVCWLF